MVYFVVALLVTFDLLTGAHSQQVVQLNRHTLPDGLQSVNGSDHIGGCSRVIGDSICLEMDTGGTITSDLDDCITPSLGEFQESWAAGLFTVNKGDQSSFYIGFEFNRLVNFTRVELDLFNCPVWGIGAQNITVYEFSSGIANFFTSSERALGHTTASTTSCTSIVRVVIPLVFPQTPTASYFIDFTFDNTTANIQWVHIAEVRFLEEEDTQCPTPSSTAETIRPTMSQETVRNTLPQETLRPTLSQETVRLTLSQETVRATLSQKSIRPIQSQETVRPTLSQETVQPSPRTAPFRDGSHLPIIAAVIIVGVVTLLVIVIGVVVLLVILVQTWRKKQQSEIEKFQSIMMDNENIELTLVKLRQEENNQLVNPHYHPYTGENILEVNREKDIPLEHDDNQPKSVSGEADSPKSQNRNVRHSPEVKEGIHPGYSEKLDTIQPLYSAVQKTRPPIPQKSSELYADLKAEKEANTDLPVYAAVVKEEPPTVPSKSEELTEYLESQNQSSNLTGEYDQISTQTVPVNSDALPPKLPRCLTLSNPVYEGVEFNLSIDHPRDPTNMPQEINSDDIYTLPDPTDSQSVEVDHGMLEVVHSEPIKPSLFTDATDSPNGSKISEDLQPYAPIYTVPVAPLQSKIVPLEVSTSNVREIRELGTGLFGQVVLAETVGLSRKDLRLSESDDDKSNSTFVAVKKLKPNAPKTTKEAFEKEVKFMSRLDNSNVIRMLGVCYEDTPFIMMEYMEEGDLNQYLKKFKLVTSTDSELRGDDQITTNTLVHIATQIASAMKYLASQNFVHRDLAIRNCLVGPNYLVKIADFGMSRSLYESHYYIIRGKAVLPVRWMSTECFYGKFSQKSDVWAFGVTMWEIFTLAKEQPYTGMSDQDIIKNAMKGTSRKLLAKPAACPPKVYEIMLTCWTHDPSQRATFEELFKVLSAIYSSY